MIVSLGVPIGILCLIALAELGRLLLFPGRLRKYAEQYPLRRRQYVSAALGALLAWPALILFGYLSLRPHGEWYWFVLALLPAVVLGFVVNRFDKRAGAAGEPTYAQWKNLNPSSSRIQSRVD